jgi:glycosyltransferase involved in cell wall biosynthesis
VTALISREGVVSRLAVIPIESVAESRSKGLANCANYYNPGGVFGEVFILSPFEMEESVADGIRVIPTLDAQLPIRLKELKIDVVRAYGGGAAADMACYNRVSGIPVVVSIHDHRPEMMRRSVMFADVVLCVAPHVREMVLHRYRDPNRVWIQPNGVDLERMKPLPKEECRQGIGWDPSMKYVLHVAHRIPEKNLRTLLEAFRLLPVSCNLVAVGLGDKGPFMKTAKTLGVMDRCRFLSTVPNSVLPTFYSAADCFCLPSLAEAMSNVTLEAFACGCPTVLSAIAALGLEVSDGREAVVVADSTDPAQLARAIQRVVEDKIFASGLIEKALAKARSFEREAVEMREMEYYNRILAMKAEGEFSLGLLNMAVLLLERMRKSPGDSPKD